MILEIADIRIHPGQQAAFEAAVAQGVAEAVSRSPGFHGYKLNRGIESPERYVLTIYWATLENHTVDFRQSERFTQWRGFVGGFFAQPPHVEHFDLASKSA